MKIRKYRTRLKYASTFALGLAFMAYANQAQACATCGVTLSTNWETQGVVSTQGWSADVTYSYLNQNKQRYGSGKASSAKLAAFTTAGGEVEDYTRTQTVTTKLNYTRDSWGLRVELPYVKRTHATYGAAYPTSAQYLTSSASGLGDIRIMAHYSGYSSHGGSDLLVGLKLPTGATNQYFSDGVTPLDTSLQLGTGSTDAILGGYTSGSIAGFGLFGQGTWQHAITTKTGLGNVTYKPGDAFIFNAGIRHSSFGDKFVPAVQFNAIHRNVDIGTSVPIDPITGESMSGGTLVYITPGMTYRIGGGFLFHAFVQLPVYQKVNSLQLTPSYIMSTGIRYNF